jgi:ornithine cyclodeaminase/alanine dehydrogenase-like protein (mu-crystallin family)
MLLLSNDDVETVLDVKSCIAAMEDGYRELGAQRGASGGRSEILTPTQRDDGLYSLLTMSGVAPKFGVGAVRINSDILTWPQSPEGIMRAYIPLAPGGRYVGLVLLFSVDTGEPLAIYPDGVVQRLRVAATCGLAAQYLARKDARVAGLLGTGWQAGGQAAAIAAVRPIERIQCFSPDEGRRQAFADERSRQLGIDVVAVASAREAVDDADVVMCATSSMQPVLSAEWVRPGMHVSSLKRLELDASVAGRADIVITHVRKSSAQIVRTAGAELARDTELEKAALSMALKQDELPDLADLVLNRTAGRRSDRDITLFLNYMGLGYQFAVTGHAIWQRARERGIGRQLDTDWFTSEVPS